MGDFFLHDGAVQIVRAEGEGNLGQPFSQHHPIGFDVVEIVQHQPGHGHHFEVVHGPGAGKIGKLGVGGMKGQRNEGGKAAGAVLKFPEPEQVPNALLDGLDVAVQQGGVGDDAFAMQRLGDLQPAVAADFIGVQFPPNPLAKHLRAAAGHHAQSGFLEGSNGSGQPQAAQLGHVVDFHRRKRLDGRLGPHEPGGADHVQVILKGQTWIDAAHDMDFPDGVGGPLQQALPHVENVHGERPVSTVGIPAEGAKPALVPADVGVVQVLILDEEGPVAVPSPTIPVGQASHANDIRRFEQNDPVLRPQSFALVQPGGDFDQSRIGK